MPARFAYGALAAYQVDPAVRRGPRPRCARRAASAACADRWHPRLLVGLLVLAIRHGDRMALSMDARAFGSGPRTPLPRAALVAAGCDRRGGALAAAARDPRYIPPCRAAGRGRFGREPQQGQPVTDARTIVFFPEGAFGPTNNCVGIGQVLRARGHRVVFIVEESFAGTLEAKGFEERLMRLGPPPAEPEVPGQFWIDFIRDTAPVFRKPTLEQLGEFIAPTWQAPDRWREVRRPAARRDLRRARARRDRRGQRRGVPGDRGSRAGRGSGSCRATRWR